MMNFMEFMIKEEDREIKELLLCAEQSDKQRQQLEVFSTTSSEICCLLENSTEVSVKI